MKQYCGLDVHKDAVFIHFGQHRLYGYVLGAEKTLWSEFTAQTETKRFIC